jgi:hypothetical protein
MIWLTWRQSRVQVAVLGGGLALLLALLLLSRGGMPAFDGDFLGRFVTEDFLSGVYTAGIVAGLCAPAVVGVFWGAPLVARELEAGTHQLVWSQSVTRTRWLATKLALTCAVAMAAVGALSLALTWWSGSLDKAINAGQQQNGLFGIARIAPPLFEARGLTPIAYTAFALVLGTAVGMLVRRVVPAMAITLAVFIVVQIGVPMFVREHLGATSSVTAITAENLVGLMIGGISPEGTPLGPVEELKVAVDAPGSWVVANRTLDPRGRVQDQLPAWVARCVPAEAAKLGGAPYGAEESAACFARLRTEGYRQRVSFMPANHYWRVQALESALFLALAGLLAAGSFWWLRHRVT